MRLLFVSYCLNSRTLSLTLPNKPLELQIIILGFIMASGKTFFFFYRVVPLITGL